MSVEKPSRLALYTRLGEVPRPEHADTLISGLQMRGGLVTKSDLRAETVEIQAEIREIHKAIHSQNRLIIVAMTGLTGIFSGIVGVIT